MSPGKRAKSRKSKRCASRQKTTARQPISAGALDGNGWMNMASNCEGTRLCIGMTLVIMDKAKRWFNNFFFAPFDANFIRLEFFPKRLFVIAEDESNVCVVR